MAALGLAGPPAPKFQTTTDSNHARPTAAEMLDRDFFATRKTERWITDIAYAWTAEGRLYLAAVSDP